HAAAGDGAADRHGSGAGSPQAHDGRIATEGLNEDRVAGGGPRLGAPVAGVEPIGRVIPGPARPRGRRGWRRRGSEDDEAGGQNGGRTQQATQRTGGHALDSLNESTWSNLL